MNFRHNLRDWYLYLCLFFQLQVDAVYSRIGEIKFSPGELAGKFSVCHDLICLGVGLRLITDRKHGRAEDLSRSLCLSGVVGNNFHSRGHNRRGCFVDSGNPSERSLKKASLIETDGQTDHHDDGKSAQYQPFLLCLHIVFFSKYVYCNHIIILLFHLMSKTASSTSFRLAFAQPMSILDL